MNVWLLKIGESLPTNAKVRLGRTASIADALLKRGHRVIWWTSAFNHQTRVMEYKGDSDVSLGTGYNLKILRGMSYKRNVSVRRYVDHRIISKKFKKYAYEMQRPDVIVAAMPAYDLASEAVHYGKRMNVPVIVDVRDQWPDLIIHNIPKPLQSVARVALRGDFKKMRYLLTNADGITSIMKPILKWAQGYSDRDHGDKAQVFYLGARRSAYAGDEIRPELQQKVDALQGKYVVLFVGTFNEYYHPDVIIKAAKLLEPDKCYADVQFVIAGHGPYYEDVRKSAKESKNITLTGWLDNDEIAYLLSLARVGVCHCAKEVTAFPNKAYVYLSAGLPLISSVSGELADIIADEKVGVNVNVGDAHELKDAVKRLYDNTDMTAEMARRAWWLFRERFDAVNIYNRYVDYVESMVESK